jgi:Ran GTPase-activating protein (RanGAP) involved in mRNA processing and transport
LSTNVEAGTTAAIRGLVTQLKQGSQLESVDLFGNHIGEGNTALIRDLLKQRKVRSINLLMLLLN